MSKIGACIPLPRHPGRRKVTDGDALDKPQLQVLGIAGSLRAGSYNRALLRAAQEIAPEGVEITTFDLAPIPPYNADVERQELPKPVAALKTAIRDADALLIATPEYNRSMPGLLKNALDWASRPPTDSPLNGKPVAIMGVSTGSYGTVRAQGHLRRVCLATNMLPLNRPELYVARAEGEFDVSGELVDEATRRRVAKLLQALSQWVRRLSDAE
jgi:chromate reductase